jgi:ribosome biogenesis GTPase
MQGWHDGLVVSAHGRHCVVESSDGERRICHPRGKKNAVVVGDRVRWQASADEGTIEQVLPRRNLLYRQDEIRTKSFAANIDQVLILIAAQPEFSAMQLARALIAAEAQRIPALIVLNKRDLGDAFDRAWQRLAPHRAAGHTVLPLCLRDGDPTLLAALREQLEGRVTLVMGPSGVGKSTLINALVPQALADTAEISLALNSGKHTTTHTRWYWMGSDHTTALIDSPGFQEFGLQHIGAADLALLMPDLRAHAGDCRFYNCTHIHEPGCSVQAAVERGEIDPHRYEIYRSLHAELSQTRY